MSDTQVKDRSAGSNSATPNGMDGRMLSLARRKAMSLGGKAAVSKTGGQAFFPRSVADLQAVIAQLMKMLRTQYIVGYKPAGDVLPATYRHVKVTVIDKPGGDKRSAVTRAGLRALRYFCR